MITEKNQRGFNVSNFVDTYNQKCSLQKSSSAIEDRIWIGVDDV